MSWKKSIELDYAIANEYKKIKNESRKLLDDSDIAVFVEVLGEYYNAFITRICNAQEVDEKGNLFEIMELPVEELLQEFNIPEFYGVLKHYSQYSENVLKLFNNSEEIRKNMMKIVQYNLIEDYGKSYGPERAFILAKMFPESASSTIPMAYASYKDRYDEKFIRFLKDYLELPNSSESIYWIPKYFDNVKNDKYKYCVEELGTMIDTTYDEETRNYIRGSKQKVR